MGEASLLEVVQACNKITHNPGKLQGCYKLYLPDKDRNLKVFGYIRREIRHALRWTEHGFTVSGDEVEDKRDDKGSREKGEMKISPKTPDPETITKNLEAIATDGLALKHPAVKQLKVWKGEYVSVVEGHPDLKVRDGLGVYLGLVQVGVHLSIYKEMPPVEGKERTFEIFVQTRSLTASYGGMLDQPAAGGLLYGETPKQGIAREADEEIKKDRNGRLIKPLLAKGVVYDGHVSFFNIRGDDKFNGSLEPSMKACYTIKVPSDWEPPSKSSDSDVADFMGLSPDQVVAELRKGSFKPNSALVMIKFLLDHGFINGEPDFGDIKTQLNADIGLPQPTDLLKIGIDTAHSIA